MQIFSEMKKFVLKIGLFLLIVVCADVMIGHGLNYITSHITVGGQGRDNYIANEAKDGILVFGSSRAVHHYNTPMLEDSLKITSYNCGEDGNGVILGYARLLMIKERHEPQIIIYDVMPEYDLFKNDNHKYLGSLRSHYDKDILHPIFVSVDKTEQYKMISRLYRYNSRFLQNLVIFFTGYSNDGGIKGYRPSKGNLDKMKITNSIADSISYAYDSLKIDYINRFIELSKGARLYFVVSPIWYGMDSIQFQPIKEICEIHGIPFIDFSNDPKFVHNDDLFIDGSHLNEKGADVFTQELIQLLKIYE